jgi:hypothetical protein
MQSGNSDQPCNEEGEDGDEERWAPGDTRLD